MREVTEEEVTEVLHASTSPERDKGVRFHGSIVWHSEAQARQIVRFCLMLDRPVTDVLTSELFGALVDEVASLRGAVYRLGGLSR